MNDSGSDSTMQATELRAKDQKQNNFTTQITKNAKSGLQAIRFVLLVTCVVGKLISFSILSRNQRDHLAGRSLTRSADFDVGFCPRDQTGQKGRREVTMTRQHANGQALQTTLAARDSSRLKPVAARGNLTARRLDRWHGRQLGLHHLARAIDAAQV
jgi:hypothetical protein